MTLDEQITTNLTIEFYNTTSAGTNLTNTNATFDARADFYGLQVGLTLRNINTSTDLFTSAAGNDAFNATFGIGELIRIMSMTTTPATVCTPGSKTFLTLALIFFALAIMIVPISVLFIRGTLSFEETDPKILITIFITVIVGLAFIPVIASSIATACP